MLKLIFTLLRKEKYEKFLGIVKLYNESMNGTNIKILSKTYDEIELINKWFDLYPSAEHVILNNTQELNSMFEIFKDMTPITQEEKDSIKSAKKLLYELMKD